MKWPNIYLKNLRSMKNLISSKIKPKKINLNNATLTDIMTLDGMDEDLAIEICEYIKDNIITDASDLLEIESINKHMIARWDNKFDDMRYDINKVNGSSLKKIKGINRKVAKLILDQKSKISEFKSIDELFDIYGISKNKIYELRARFKIEKFLRE